MSRIVATFYETLLFGGRWGQVVDMQQTSHSTIWLLIIPHQSTHSQVPKEKKVTDMIDINWFHTSTIFFFVFKTNNISYTLLFFLVSIAFLTCLITCGTEDDHETKMILLFMCCQKYWGNFNKALSFAEDPSLFELQTCTLGDECDYDQIPTLLYFAFSSVQFSCVRLFATPWIATCQASLSITNSQSLLKLMSMDSVMPSIHLILCCPLLLLPPILPSIRVFSNESPLLIRWPK